MKRFLFQIGRRPDLSGLPYGFWFGWAPREPDPPHRFGLLIFRWHVGLWWYPPGRFYGQTLRQCLPRLHFGGAGPITQ